MMFLLTFSSDGSSKSSTFLLNTQVFFKENIRYRVWTCRDPIFSDSRDPIFNSRDPNRVCKTP